MTRPVAIEPPPLVPSKCGNRGGRATPTANFRNQPLLAVPLGVMSAGTTRI
jgi:hypothetical protein